MSKRTHLPWAFLVGLGLGLLPYFGSPAQAQISAPASVPPALPDGYAAHGERAMELMKAEQYLDALKEIEAAYAMRQVPHWLYLQGAVHQKLGHAKEARDAYQRYLVAAQINPDANPEQIREADRRVSELSRLLSLTEPRAMPRPENLPYRVETSPRHRGMIAAGWTLLSIGYAFAFGTGVAYTVVGGGCYGSSSCAGRDSRVAGGTLLIPVVGPLISSAAYYNGILYWGLPWLLTDLPLQLVGLGLIIQGHRTKQVRIVPNVPDDAHAVRLRPYWNPDGAGMIAVGSF